MAHGTLDSHEIPGKAPLLLSQNAQMSLGMIKDMGKGLCTVALPSPPDVPIVAPLRRTHDSRLLAIWLSEGLKGDKIFRIVREYRIPQQPHANPPTAYMAKKGAKDKGGKQTSKAQTPKGETKSEPKPEVKSPQPKPL